MILFVGLVFSNTFHNYNQRIAVAFIYFRCCVEIAYAQLLEDISMFSKKITENQ